jgi:hypothetical protein
MLPRTPLKHLVFALSLTAVMAQGFAFPHQALVQTGQVADKADKADKEPKDNDRDVHSTAALWAQITHPVLWHQQTNISGLDMYAGQGGTDKMPKPPFVFESEDKNGTNPKMDVRDADGKKWRVKTGEEARPEVVASRLLWAMGYYVNDDYVLPQATVAGIKNMSRGPREVKEGNLSDARFERKPSGQNKIGTWAWKTNPFYGKREFNGLRVMMAVINNWDLKDENNSVYTDKKTGEQIFLVNDIGATFGSNGLEFSKSNAKGNVHSYEQSGFVERLTETEVDFSTPKAPAGVLVASFGFSAKSYASRKGLEWIGNNIPREDAKWMGSLLANLTHKQLQDAFRAGNFPSDEVDQYVQVIESRIAELKKL